MSLYLLRIHVRTHTHTHRDTHRADSLMGIYGKKENDSAAVPADAAFPKHKNMSRHRCGRFFLFFFPPKVGPPPFLPSSKGRKKNNRAQKTSEPLFLAAICHSYPLLRRTGVKGKRQGGRGGMKREDDGRGGNPRKAVFLLAPSKRPASLTRLATTLPKGSKKSSANFLVLRERPAIRCVPVPPPPPINSAATRSRWAPLAFVSPLQPSGSRSKCQESDPSLRRSREKARRSCGGVNQRQVLSF